MADGLPGEESNCDSGTSNKDETQTAENSDFKVRETTKSGILYDRIILPVVLLLYNSLLMAVRLHLT